jgi:hypothetical protein
MKRETLRHPKTYDLAARLGCSRATALGYLTLLWDFTAEVSTDGSIGRWPDGSIARACDWEGDPAEFVAGLTAAGWLDEDPTHRLLIHDWPEHCERWVTAKLAKLGKDFAQPTTSTASGSAEPSTERSAEATAEPSLPRDQTKPNQTEPNRTKPKWQPADAELPGELDCDEFRSSWLDWLKHKRQRKDKPMTKIGTERCLKHLRDMGVERAVAAIEHSIENSYAGIHEPMTRAGPQTQSRRRLKTPAELRGETA